jgi:hypothetical protein
VRPPLRKTREINELRATGDFQEIGYKEIISMSELINWRTEWQEALHEAKKANRPLALEFYMEG